MFRIPFVVFIVIFSLIFPFFETTAATWNPSMVITDADLEDFTTMSQEDIQHFLETRGSLGSYSAIDTDGKEKSAAEIIFRIARTYKLNPQFLLALMQREQGIVEKNAPTEAELAWATGYAVCDSCAKDDPLLQPFRGFATQLEQSAKRFRETFFPQIDTQGATLTGWGPGIASYVDGTYVMPANRATAALYTYTPHLAGNRLLWRVWQRWFSERYPDGSLLADSEDMVVWLIDHGLKRAIASPLVLLSRFNPKKIITVTREELRQYAEGRPFHYPDHSLLRSPRGTVYLIRGNERIGFPSREVFRKLGFHDDEVIDATWEELDAYREGAPLSTASTFPRGALLQDRLTGGIYYAEDGGKHPIWAREILTTRFPGLPITAVNPKELEKYATLEPIRFADGELVAAAGSPDVYVVAAGALRPIPSAEIFETMGWQWEYVVRTSPKVLSLHELGEPISPDVSENITISNIDF